MHLSALCAFFGLHYYLFAPSLPLVVWMRGEHVVEIGGLGSCQSHNAAIRNYSRRMSHCSNLLPWARKRESERETVNICKKPEKPWKDAFQPQCKALVHFQEVVTKVITMFLTSPSIKSKCQLNQNRQNS